jgi:hypothetical protein
MKPCPTLAAWLHPLYLGLFPALSHDFLPQNQKKPQKYLSDENVLVISQHQNL